MERFLIHARKTCEQRTIRRIKNNATATVKGFLHHRCLQPRMLSARLRVNGAESSD